MTSRGHILVVDDERSIRRLLRMYLVDAGYTVAEASDGESALGEVRSGGIDLVLLDLMLPGMDGIEVCRRLREARPTVPVIMLTARDDEASRVSGLEFGADDYVVKPFAPRELVARVRAVLRRTQAEPEQGALVTAGRVALEPGSRTCTLDGVEVDLTRLEFDLLAELAAHPRTVYTRERLLEKVWGHQTPVGGKTVDVHVANVRRKLNGWGGIVAVRGVGYKLDPEAA
ncbi:MAG TPA: response regulator transcription factor [Miltoncostaeaceae bacterium]|nr:response regulator transcription factor [Miltoncostaeaceae bacterium]